MPTLNYGSYFCRTPRVCASQGLIALNPKAFRRGVFGSPGWTLLPGLGISSNDIVLNPSFKEDSRGFPRWFLISEQQLNPPIGPHLSVELVTGQCSHRQQKLLEGRSTVYPNSYLGVILVSDGVFEKVEYTTGKNLLHSITPQITS